MLDLPEADDRPSQRFDGHADVDDAPAFRVLLRIVLIDLDARPVIALVTALGQPAAHDAAPGLLEFVREQLESNVFGLSTGKCPLAADKRRPIRYHVRHDNQVGVYCE